MDNQQGAQFCRGCAAPMFTNQQNQQQQNQQQFHQGFAPRNTQMQQGASGRAITAMVLSLVGILFCGLFLTLPGMILGKIEMTAIQEGRAPQAGLGMAKTGFYSGLVGTVLYSVLIGIFILSAVSQANY
jgi:predicted lipid-binding transport protein (Tim44 family)